jgi:hypothetical protein
LLAGSEVNNVFDSWSEGSQEVKRTNATTKVARSISRDSDLPRERIVKLKKFRDFAAQGKLRCPLKILCNIPVKMENRTLKLVDFSGFAYRYRLFGC